MSTSRRGPRGRDGELHREALTAAMDAIPSAAFLVRRDGAFEHANGLGVKLLGRRGSDLGPRLTAAISALGTGRPLDTPFTVTPVGAEAFLVVHAGPPESAAHLISQAATLWKLTPQQAIVLGLLAEGAPNKVMAGQLRCSVRTVELHVSAILKKARVGSRVGVVARLWELEQRASGAAGMGGNRSIGSSGGG